MNLTYLVLIAGWLHFGILLASFAVPRVLDWQRELEKVPPLLRQLVWVHGAFVVLMIVGFGTLSVLLPSELASGSVLAKSVTAFVAFFWLIRVALQYTYFDAKPHLLRAPILRLGYHALTVVFLFHVVVYGMAALQ